ncbi:class I SAM-dependent methyltransferase [Succinivibrio dextrinosolvens]|uniref:SAM-dependent methyltransferase n=1 Tax=Succinivibrio dextrinosolvens TaxID=83771 RepID=A0A662Z9R6_9GAMM|nr:methionine biosynthesis protein MetW [Succinivibrio dextrinosolvens]SFK14651.1 SAM-dependent methyltransferase [Succinivibrio dextrinosolvens]
MSDFFYDFFKKLKTGTEIENYGRNIIKKAVFNHISVNKLKSVKILDLGAGPGTDLQNSKNSAESAGCENVELYAIENYLPNVNLLQNQGVSVQSINLENDNYDYESSSIDIVIMNQCLEHTKEIFHIFSEIGRILKPNGILIVGVPNLASFHNRILLLLGKQPSAIHTLGPHVRGFTKKDFTKFFTAGEFFSLNKTYGSNFYPFPVFISRFLSKIWPTGSVSLFYVIERTNKNQGKFSDYLKDHFFETPYIE